jgi:Zn-dependent protease
MCACIKLCFPFYRAMAEVNLFVSLKNLIPIS